MSQIQLIVELASVSNLQNFFFDRTPKGVAKVCLKFPSQYRQASFPNSAVCIAGFVTCCFISRMLMYIDIHNINFPNEIWCEIPRTEQIFISEYLYCIFFNFLFDSFILSQTYPQCALYNCITYYKIMTPVRKKYWCTLMSKLENSGSCPLRTANK